MTNIKSKKRTGIYGGTFNPPHIGHIHAAKTAYKHLGLDEIILIPSNIPPHKSLPEESATPLQRFDMVKIISKDIEFSSVSDIELKRCCKSYTVDTLRELKEQYGDSELIFIMGSDMLFTFDKWKQPEIICRLCKIAVQARKCGEIPDLEKYEQRFKQLYNADIEVIHSDYIEVCSTDIREQLKAGIRTNFLTPEIFSYIKENGLYGWNERLYRLREDVRAILSEKRFKHTLGCEEEAAKLAGLWGCNPYDAREAAILHDISKELSYEEQIKLCEKYISGKQYYKELHPNLLHAITGSCIAKDVYNSSEQVKNAIRWHTTGHKNMTLLEKIIFLADCIEPSRKHEGIEESRRLAYENMDMAVLSCLEGICKVLVSSGDVPSKDSLEAISQLHGI